MMTATRKPLGQLMLQRGIVKQEQIDRALDEQRRGGHRKLLGELLIEMKCCSEDQVTEILAISDGLPYARVSPKLVDAKVVALLPAKFLDENNVLPMFLVERCLTVAIAEPANVFLLEEIGRLSGGCTIQPVAATARDIRATLKTLLGSDSGFILDGLPESGPEETITLAPGAANQTSTELPPGDPTIVRLVCHCIHSAIAAAATDIHIEPGDRELRVRLRIDGRLIVKLRPPLAIGPAVIGYLKALTGLDPQNRAASSEGSVAVMVNGKAIELRLSTLTGSFGEIAVIQVSDGGSLPSNLEKLGFGYDTLKQWRKLIRLQSGLILASAPAGSGKRATLYATAVELNSSELNICTIEETIQHRIAGVNQFRLDRAVGPGVPAALRSILNQQPDVIAICDLPDSESARLAAQSALSGHLVIAALRANDAPMGIARLNHLGIEPHLIGATLAGVLSQRLVRKLCPRCKEPVTPTARQRRQIEKIGAETDVVYRPRGCDHCRNLGFIGRIGIYELLIPDENILESINAGASLRQLRELAQAAGMRTIRDDGIEKVNAGITTLEEVHRVTA